MTCLAFYECCLSEKRDVSSLFFCSGDNSCSQRPQRKHIFPGLLSLLLPQFFYGNILTNLALKLPRHILKYNKCVVPCLTSGQWKQSGSVPLTLQVLGAHFINTCWEFRACGTLNPGWSTPHCVWVSGPLSGFWSASKLKYQISSFCCWLEEPSAWTEQ